MCGQHNIRTSAEDNTGQNTDKEHTPNPRTKLKFLTPPGIEPGSPGWKIGTLPTTLRDGLDLLSTIQTWYHVICVGGIGK